MIRTTHGLLNFQLYLNNILDTRTNLNTDRSTDKHGKHVITSQNWWLSIKIHTCFPHTTIFPSNRTPSFIQAGSNFFPSDSSGPVSDARHAVSGSVARGSALTCYILRLHERVMLGDAFRIARWQSIGVASVAPANLLLAGSFRLANFRR